MSLEALANQVPANLQIATADFTQYLQGHLVEAATYLAVVGVAAYLGRRCGVFEDSFTETNEKDNS
jgi:hypothetical protein